LWAFGFKYVKVGFYKKEIDFFFNDLL
jgi:hypothetical protein